jgi:hypothetical protein
MAIRTPRIKATYSLDVDTVQRLEQAAAHWGVSKSEALTRAIRAIAIDDVAARLALVDALHAASDGNVKAADRRIAALRAERRAGRR